MNKMTSDKLDRANVLSKEIAVLQRNIDDMELLGIRSIKLTAKESARDIVINEQDIVNLVHELSASMLKRKLVALEKEFDEL